MKLFGAPVAGVRSAKGRVAYANVVATLALFVALGGASYAAVQLPADSVETRQLAFPLGVTAANGAGSTLNVSECSGPVRCPVPPPTSLVSARITLKRPSKLVIVGSATFLNGPGSSDPVAVNLGAVAAGRFQAESAQLVGYLPVTIHFTRVVSASAGRHAIPLEADASSAGSSPQTVSVGNPSIEVIALPSIH